MEKGCLSFYISGANWSAEDILPCLMCSPGLLVRGQALDFSPGSNPRERPGIQIQGFSPGGGASNSIPRDADDQANSSGLSLKPALTGFCQMYVWWCL
jgi:hypothetical protein